VHYAQPSGTRDPREGQIHDFPVVDALRAIRNMINLLKALKDMQDGKLFLEVIHKAINQFE
jgi:hypothetical protein